MHEAFPKFSCQHEPAIEGCVYGCSMYEEFVCDVIMQILASTKWQLAVSFGSFLYFFQCFFYSSSFKIVALAKRQKWNQKGGRKRIRKLEKVSWTTMKEICISFSTSGK